MVNVLSRKVDRLTKAHQILDAGAVALRQALLKYGDHDEGCNGGPCVCGWEDTRKIVEK